MVSRKETVDRAISFAHPRSVPIVFWNRDQLAGDVTLYHLSLGEPGDGDSMANAWDWSTNEWGYRLDSMDDGTMGHPTEALWVELPESDRVCVPPLREAERMAAVGKFVAESGDRYRLASLDLSGFTVYTLLRGFENAMLDFAGDPDRFRPVMDLITDFECRLMEMAEDHRAINICYDPSHFVLQQLDYLAFVELYGDRIKSFHVKDAEFHPTGRVGVYGGYESWSGRAGRFRSLGDGQVDFSRLFTLLTEAGYDGWAVLEWECCVKSPEQGAREGALFIARHLIERTDIAFDDFAGSQTDAQRNRRILGLP